MSNKKDLLYSEKNGIRCPHCGEKLDCLVVEVRGYTYMSIPDEVFDGAVVVEETIEYECPECGGAISYD